MLEELLVRYYKRPKYSDWSGTASGLNIAIVRYGNTNR